MLSALKFLSSINYPESLAKDAMDELKRPRDKKRFARQTRAAQAAVAAAVVDPNAKYGAALLEVPCGKRCKLSMLLEHVVSHI